MPYQLHILPFLAILQHRTLLGSAPSHYFLHRAFYDDATRPGVIVNPLENAVVIVSVVLGYFFAMLLRIFVIVIIMLAFFGLIRHARLEDSVAKVGADMVNDQCINDITRMDA